VPNVVGLTSDEAANKIAEAGFVLRQTTSEYSDKIPAEHIMRQTPAAGQQQEPLKPVDIVISLGPNPMKQPETPITEIQPPGEGANVPPESDSKPRERAFNVHVNVPDDVQAPQDVRIIVIDDYGETEVYNETHSPGDEFDQQVRGFGTSVEIKVFVGDQLVEDETY
jgi:hypothetical protein